MAVNDAAVLRCVKCGSGIKNQHGRGPDSQSGAFHVVMGQDGSAAIEWSEDEMPSAADLLAQEAGLSGQASSPVDRPSAGAPPALGSALPQSRPANSLQAQKLGISFAGGAIVAAIVVVSVYEVQHMWREARLGASSESAQETRRSEGFATDPRVQRNPLLR